ncbi:MAG: macrolide ABC transporter ATP-binding protein [Acidobacteria bacterium]|nr:MAG: macrolide ABC transporter ATP-binding protein [Acidobacteriota bacterium]
MTKTPSSSFDILASLSPASSGAPRLNGADSRVSGIISLREVSKTYDLGEVRVEALKGLSLEITGGQFVAIMGASGSGKSTMLNILGCLDRPSSGVYLLDGVDVSTFSAAQRADIRNQKIGFIFQSFNLLARTTVWENIEAPMLYGGVPKPERAKRIEEALKVVGIPEKAKALPNQLSGGQQQRVAVARALVNRPAILLADEPTGNLDSATSEEIMRFLQHLNRQKQITLVMVTHEHDIAAYASRIIHMKDGRILSDEVNEEMKRDA